MTHALTQETQLDYLLLEREIRSGFARRGWGVGGVGWGGVGPVVVVVVGGGGG